MSSHLGKLEDILTVAELDKDGKTFDKVSRVFGKTSLYETDVVLDINTSIYPVKAGEKYTLKLATSIQADGSATDPYFNQAHKGSKTVLDQWEYVMYGKVFKHKDMVVEGALPRLEVYMSFGGLLMRMRGDPKKLQELEVDTNLYLLMRKVFKHKDMMVEGALPRLEVYMSFWGLLMCMRMRGDPKKLQVLEVDTNLYLLMRKV